MKNRQVGYLIIGIALLIGFIIYLFNRAMTTIVATSCSHGTTCPMWGTINFQTNVSLGIMIFIIIIGTYMIYAKEPSKKPKRSYSKEIASMSPEEKEIFQHILGADGSVFQSELVKISGLTKVKVTRVLDKLEGKGLIERKRRGMANVVLLKH